MSLKSATVFVFLMISLFNVASASTKKITLHWETTNGISGAVTVDRGTLDALSTPAGTTDDGQFTLSRGKSGRLDLVIGSSAKPGALPTLVTLSVAPRGFAFILSDVSARSPIYLPDDQIIVTESSDTRSYAEIVAAIKQQGSQTKLQRIAAAREASFESAAAQGREVKAQTWLGVSRDMRIFRIDENLETFQPKFAGYDTQVPEVPKQASTYAFQLGRGWGPRENITRALEESVLPILRGQIDDEAISYDLTLFAALEKSPLTTETVRGTDFLVADAFGHGHMFTPEQAEREKQRRDAELNPPEEVVLYARATATNRSRTPAYAVFKTVTPSLATPISPRLPEWTFDAAHGFGAFASGRVFAISKLNGAPLPSEEPSVLLGPGESAVLEFFVPHRPLDRERALALAAQSFDERLAGARSFWQGKLKTAAQWTLPEPRLQHMTRAGLLHLDLVAYGREPKGPLLPSIGIYTAIGSESAPIIQYMDSMGWHDTAARAIDFFLEKQRDNGFMQNFNGYMLETGAVLWTMGEHYRYTRDDAWLQRVHPKITKAWHYLRDWRRRNLQLELKGDGYGMLDGKTADPEDPYRSFMLNGYAYLGLLRTAEMLRTLAPQEAAESLAEAEMLKNDIRTTLIAAMQRSPLIPMGDGTWSRTAPPWTNYRGPLMLHADGGRWFTHGSMIVRDSLLGPLYLVFQEVVAPHETMATELLETHSELMMRDNVAFSQPYYSQHPWVHLQRGETKAFLQAWYGAVATLADRGTFTFQEHFFPVSAHKTHEEAWFLMQTRWMLYLEQGETLRLLAGVPRDYLRPKAEIAVKGAASYFGPLNFAVKVSADGRTMSITIDCASERRPKQIEMRVPHPQGLRASSVTGAAYVPESEMVRIDHFTGHAEVQVNF